MGHGLDQSHEPFVAGGRFHDSLELPEPLEKCEDGPLFATTHGPTLQDHAAIGRRHKSSSMSLISCVGRSRQISWRCPFVETVGNKLRLPRSSTTTNRLGLPLTAPHIASTRPFEGVRKFRRASELCVPLLSGRRSAVSFGSTAEPKRLSSGTPSEFPEGLTRPFHASRARPQWVARTTRCPGRKATRGPRITSRQPGVMSVDRAASCCCAAGTSKLSRPPGGSETTGRRRDGPGWSRIRRLGRKNSSFRRRSMLDREKRKRLAPERRPTRASRSYAVGRTGNRNGLPSRRFIMRPVRQWRTTSFETHRTPFGAARRRSRSIRANPFKREPDVGGFAMPTSNAVGDAGLRLRPRRRAPDPPEVALLLLLRNWQHEAGRMLPGQLHVFLDYAKSSLNMRCARAAPGFVRPYFAPLR